MDSGFELVDVDDGDLTSVSDTSILGAEQPLVHEAPSTVDVTTSSPEPGDNVTVDVNAAELEGDVNHAIVLYDGDMLSMQEITVNVTEPLSADLGVEDITLDHKKG